MSPSRKAAIAASFGRAAATYDADASVQRQSATALAARIAALPWARPPHLLEIGCGTGLLTRALLRMLPEASGLITDLSPAMVRTCRNGLPGADHLYAAMDGEAPCLAGPRFALICANLAFQWFEHPARSLAALHALLCPGGWLAFATLGPASLEEWRAAHAAEGLTPPTPDFADPATLLATWPGGARDHSLDRSMITVAHGSGRAFLASLRAIGALVPRADHARLNPGQLRRVLARFERDHDATARYEIVQVCLRRNGGPVQPSWI